MDGEGEGRDSAASLIGRPLDLDGDERPARKPIENPQLKPIDGDPLLDPHPAEPGVNGNGDCSPLENPASARRKRPG